ncbi:hypothetical protein B0J13DRAFT_521685 [Dactylonectria estremocensis]|uniref:Uncharacterized protein n=1 Tax=Dactylonectria estremocensis TaxID=1079267 RepID=A0A9P9F901_9HYPO|nr:hypothetical protein B0J13DRAFT_521685 [Dactylonectria estremocensis]
MTMLCMSRSGSGLAEAWQTMVMRWTQPLVQKRGRKMEREGVCNIQYHGRERGLGPDMASYCIVGPNKKVAVVVAVVSAVTFSHLHLHLHRREDHSRTNSKHHDPGFTPLPAGLFDASAILLASALVAHP